MTRRAAVPLVILLAAAGCRHGAGVDAETAPPPLVTPAPAEPQPGQVVPTPPLPGQGSPVEVLAAPGGPVLPEQGAPPAAVEVGGPGVFHVGGREESWTLAGYFRANVYRATRSVTLEELRVFLALPEQQACPLGFHVLASQSREGPYAPVWSRPAVSSGAGYHSSGPIGLRTTPGMYYALGVGWSCEATYYSSTYGQYEGVDAGLGPLEGNAWSNEYQGYSPSFTPPNAVFDGTANYDQVLVIGQ